MPDDLAALIARAEKLRTVHSIIPELVAALKAARAELDQAVDDWGANDEMMLADNARLAEELKAARAEVERLARAGKTLGKIIDDSLRDVLEATGSHDLIGEDGDGDWMLVFERLMELRPARDAAEAELKAARAENERLRGGIRIEVSTAWESFKPLTPDQARALGNGLLAAADTAEAK